MQTRPVQLTDVIYNAASQSFEALVTVHDGNRSRRYPCAINAPITMSFELAARGLSTQALRRHTQTRGTYSEFAAHRPPLRAGRRRFDLMRWLESVVGLPDQRAA